MKIGASLISIMSTVILLLVLSVLFLFLRMVAENWSLVNERYILGLESSLVYGVSLLIDWLIVFFFRHVCLILAYLVKYSSGFKEGKGKIVLFSFTLMSFVTVLWLAIMRWS